MTIRNFSCGRVGDVCYFAQTDMISHPAFVRVWLGFETGVAEYFRAPVFCFSGFIYCKWLSVARMLEQLQLPFILKHPITLPDAFNP